jgi:hypothetical protein
VAIPMGRDRLTVKSLALPGCAPASASERLFDGLTVRTDDSTKIIPGGNSGGRMPPAGASGGQPPLATVSVGAGQGLYGRYRDFLVVHGKEKVYGSIP